MKKKIIVLALATLVCLNIIGCEKKSVKEKDAPTTEEIDYNEGLVGEVGGTTVYQDVKTKIMRFEWCEYSEVAPVKRVYELQEDGTVLNWDEDYWNEDIEKKEIDPEILSDLEKWIDNNDIKKWDGFNMTDTYVCDGGGFRIYVVLETGETISANGSNAYPEGYGRTTQKLTDILDFKYATEDYED